MDIWEAAKVGDGRRVRKILKSDPTALNAINRVGWTPLMYAARYDQQAVLTYLLSKGADVNALDMHGETALNWAAQFSNWEAVATLITHGARVEHPNEDGETLIHRAVLDDRVELLGALFARGASVDIADRKGWTPLHWACRKGRLEAATVLINRGADVDALDEQGWTPVHWAANQGHLQVLELLIQHGANPTKPSHDSETPYDVAGSLDTKLYLREGDALRFDTLRVSPAARAASLHRINSAENVAEAGAPLQSIHEAAREGNIEIVTQHLHLGTDVDTVDYKNQWSALHYAAEAGQEEMVKFLVKRCRASVDVVGAHSHTPILLASFNQHWGIVKLLASKGANLTYCDHNSETSIGHAARYNAENAISMLLKLGADPTLGDKNGMTTLHWTARNGCVGGIRTLLDSGKIDVDVTDNQNWTPLHHAGYGKQPAATRALLSYHADLTIADPNGFHAIDVADPESQKLIRMRVLEEALLDAASEGELNKVRHLVSEKGVNASYADKHGVTAVILSVKGEFLEQLKFLIDVGEADVTCIDDTGRAAQDYAWDLEDMQYLSVLARAIRDYHTRLVDSLPQLYVEDFSKTSFERLAYAGESDEVFVYIRSASAREGEAAVPSKESAAAFYWDAKTVRYLVSLRAAANVMDSAHETPLFFAARSNDIRVVAALLRLGASPHHKNPEGKVPHEETTDIEVRRLLLNAAQFGTLPVGRKGIMLANPKAGSSRPSSASSSSTGRKGVKKNNTSQKRGKRPGSASSGGSRSSGRGSSKRAVANARAQQKGVSDKERKVKAAIKAKAKEKQKLRARALAEHHAAATAAGGNVSAQLSPDQVPRRHRADRSDDLEDRVDDLVAQINAERAAVQHRSPAPNTSTLSYADVYEQSMLGNDVSSLENAYPGGADYGTHVVAGDYDTYISSPGVSVIESPSVRYEGSLEPRSLYSASMPGPQNAPYGPPPRYTPGAYYGGYTQQPQHQPYPYALR